METETVPALAIRRYRSIGARGERVAARRLRRNGYRIIGRNIATEHGELDIVALAPDRRTIVAVEVKSRRLRVNRRTPPPEASVTKRKREKLVELTKRLISRRNWEGRPVRIDVIAVEFCERRSPVIRHYENAVTND